MKKVAVFITIMCVFANTLFANKKKPEADSISTAILKQLKLRDSLDKALKFETGIVSLQGGFVKLNIPTGFKFLNATQSKYVLSDLWGNPKRDDVLGMIFPSETDVFTDTSFVFVISYDEMGYVKDDDANEINYDDMLKQMQKEEVEENKQRAAAGYEAIHMVRWAQKPFYDSKRKVLHWAKNLKFANAETNTLNYEVRLLGRKGVLSLNAIATMDELPLVQKNIDKVLNMAEFTNGNTYAEYNSGTDKIAAWTIGGLVAGKVLAKAGLFVLLLKFWKLIVAGAVGVGYAFKKFFKRKNGDEENVA